MDKEHEHTHEGHTSHEHTAHEHSSHEHTAHEHHEQPKKMSKVQLWQIISGVLAVLLLISVLTGGFKNFGGGAGVTSSEKAKLEFYVMSQCPYGTQVEDGIKPVLDEMAKNIDFSLNFILYNKASYAGKEAQFCIEDLCSMHGIKEVKGDIVQLCAAKYSPAKYMDMIVCMNANSGNIPDNWESCATGLDSAKIKACYEGTEGVELLRASAAKADAAQASGSPTIFLNGKPYSGARDKAGFMREICNTFKTKPKACTSIPAPEKVKIVVLGDKRCKECDTTGLITQLKTLFPGLEAETLDYSDASGKKMFTDLGLQYLPAVLFDPSIKDSSEYSNIQSYIEPKGDYLSLKIGASFDPAGEICDNQIDDNNDGKIDCNDPTCTAKLECRKAVPGKLDLFVMSQCPYGTKALDAMKEVLDNFGADMKFSVHYIASENADGTFDSLHGQAEVDENIRELCAFANYPNTYMDYIWCRNKAITSTDWQKCATEAKLDVEKMKKCSEGTEGKKLLSEDIKLANALQVGGSPTWMVNNNKMFSGIDAETVKTNFCGSNTDVKGCENTLSSDTGGVAATGGCGV